MRLRTNKISVDSLNKTCYTDECNQVPFELSDPTFPGVPRPSRPDLGQICYPLCFDNDPFCLSRNPFLLITIWIAYGRALRSGSPRLHSFALLQKSKMYLLSFQSFAHSLPKTTGVYLHYSLPRGVFPRGQSGTPRSFLPRAFSTRGAEHGNSSPYFSTASALFAMRASGRPFDLPATAFRTLPAAPWILAIGTVPSPHAPFRAGLVFGKSDPRGSAVLPVQGQAKRSAPVRF